MKIKARLVLPLVMVSFFSCSYQTVIKKTWAFSVMQQPGTVPVDEQGTELPVQTDTVLIVYVETGAVAIRWDTAWLGEKGYTILSQTIATTPYEAGFTKETGQKVVIPVEAGHHLYQLVLQPIENVLPQSPPNATEPGVILLKAQYKGKQLLKKTGKIVFLEGYPAV